MGEGKKDRDSIAARMDKYAYTLYLCDSLRDRVIRTAVGDLRLPRGSNGMDAGCGIGSHMLVLAEAVSPDGGVTGLDQSSEFLGYARDLTDESPLAELLSFRKGDIYDLPFEDDAFDWVWSSDCAGYPVETHAARLIAELTRVIRPGGTLAILGWTSQLLLPGYPELEAGLNTASSLVTHSTGNAPEDHFMRAAGWLRAAGLTGVESRTYAGDIRPPLDEKVRKAMPAAFEMLWADARSSVSRKEWEEFGRLTDPSSKDYIVDLPDYCAFFNYTMFRGKVPL